MGMNLFGTVLVGDHYFLNRFVTKLENRFIKKHGKSLAKPRRYGSL